MLRRIWALTQKEFIQWIRDRRTVIAIMIGPALELLLFSAAIHTQVQHIPMVVADYSMSAASRAYLDAFVVTGDFDIVAMVSSQADVTRAIDSGQANLGVVIPPDFADQVARGDAAVLMLVDGSSSFTSQSAFNTAEAISEQYAVSLIQQQSSPLTAHIQILYNPDLKDTWFITPAFVAFLLQALTMNLTSLAVVREREMGTIEAILVTPVRPFELMLAKTFPSLLIAFGSGLIMLVIGTLVLGVPFRGSLPLFCVLALLNLGCGLGLGLAISSAVQTQNQSQQLAAMVNISGMFLAGVLFPVYTLPLTLRVVSYIFPATYFIPVSRGILVKGIGLQDLWVQTLALLVSLVVILLVATRLFRQRLD
jgi:ABC-2 type transport system permease protein